MATATCRTRGSGSLLGTVWGFLLCFALGFGLTRGTVLAAPKFQPVEFSRFYTALLPSSTNQPWSLIPRGAQTLGDIPFLIGGKLEVTGLDAARAGDWLPPRSGRIPIGAKAGRLHLLHGAAHGLRDGVPMSEIVLHFTNGESRALRLAFGVHARNWVRDPDERRSTVLDPDSTIAWASPGDDDENPRGYLRFYKTALLNPLPEETIDSLEVESLFSRATPIVFALTLEQTDLPLRPPPAALLDHKAMREASRLERTNYVRELTVRAVEVGAETSVTNASAKLQLFDGAASFPFGSGEADAAGRLTFLYPPQHAARLDVLVRAPGFAPELLSLKAESVGLIPSNAVVRLAKGRRIGGMVLSRAGQPISNAVVLAHGLRPVGSNEVLDVAWERTSTAADGRWNLDGAPGNLRGFQIQVSHAEFKTANFPVEVSPATNSVLAAAEALFAGLAVLRMEPQWRVAGMIADQRGRPVTNATVFCRFEDGDRMRRYTDARGAFTFLCEAEGRAHLTVLAPSLAPYQSEVAVAEGAKPLRITLEKGERLAFRVGDTAGQPITGAEVALDHWNYQRTIPWETTNDAQGRFVWTNAPAGTLGFSISKHGFVSRRLPVTVPAGKDLVVTMYSYGGLAGAVLDAETGRPLEKGTVTVGRRARPEEPWRWDRGNSANLKQGRFSFSVSEKPGTEAAALFEAPGHLPLIVSLAGTKGWQTNNIKLQGAAGLRGKVVLSDGSPVKGASLALVDEADEVAIEGGSFARVRNNNSELLSGVKTEEFEFRPRLGKLTVFALHAQGFAQVPAEEVARSGQVVLQPWGRIRGNVSTNLIRSAQNSWVALGHLLPEVKESGRPTVHWLSRTRPEWKGTFHFDRVPPGLWSVGLLFRAVEEPAHCPPLSHSQTVQVNSGETNWIRLGGGGRSIFGRVTVKDGTIEDLDLLRDTHTLTLRQRGAPESKAKDFSESATERQTRERKFAEAQREFWTSDQGRAARREQRSYALLFRTNGTFHADEVLPGEYTLDIAVTGQTLRSSLRELIARVQQNVTIKSTTNSEVADLGSFELQLSPLARIGQMVPDFAVRTLDGKTVRVADFRDKFLLLDLWDSSVESRHRDLHALAQTVNASSTAGRAAVLSLNFDANEALATATMRAVSRPWPQAWQGSFRKTKWATWLGLEQPGVIVLIDPQGRFAGLTDGENLPYILRRRL